MTSQRQFHFWAAIGEVLQQSKNAAVLLLEQGLSLEKVSERLTK